MKEIKEMIATSQAGGDLKGQRESGFGLRDVLSQLGMVFDIRYLLELEMVESGDRVSFWDGERCLATADYSTRQIWPGQHRSLVAA